jgi:hypothetical protein
MKTEKIIWGLVFIFGGAVLLLDNFDLIDFSWGVIWRFWPIILILIGANMLLARADARYGAAASIFITVAALGFIGYMGATSEDSSDFNFSFHRNDRDDDDGRPSRKFTSSVFTEPFKAGTGHAELNVQGGAIEYVLKDTTTDLFKAEVKRNYGNFSMAKTSRDSLEVLTFKMTGKQKWNSGRNNGNKAVILLNRAPIWDINVELGAGETNFDLTPFKLRKVSFEGGVASFNAKVGMPVGETTINAETGVAECTISVPEGAACQINVDSGLSSHSFNGFKKVSDGTYKTDNFDSATNRIIINLEGGLSDFNVKRYKN